MLKTRIDCSAVRSKCGEIKGYSSLYKTYRGSHTAISGGEQEKEEAFMILETERIILRRWEDSDAEDLYNYASSTGTNRRCTPANLAKYPAEKARGRNTKYNQL